MAVRFREAAHCHTGGISKPHDPRMDDIYLCPDCRAEHAEPYEAVLGHIARCFTCVILHEAPTGEQAIHREIMEIHVAA